MLLSRKINTSDFINKFTCEYSVVLNSKSFIDLRWPNFRASKCSLSYNEAIPIQNKSLIAEHMFN